MIYRNIKTNRLALKINDNYSLNELCTMRDVKTGEVLHWELKIDWQELTTNEINDIFKKSQLFNSLIKKL